MPVALQQKSRLTDFEMRTEFARQRREDRHVASNAPFVRVPIVNLWRIAVQK
jgi:hypothetical protein